MQHIRRFPLRFSYSISMWEQWFCEISVLLQIKMWQSFQRETYCKSDVKVQHLLDLKDQMTQIFSI